jgi:hypothetical protein
MKRKRKLKKGVRNIVYFIVFALIASFLFGYFDLWNKIERIFNNTLVKIGTIYVEKPKVKIINEESNSRIIAVSINNNHSAWPHAGLQDAFLGYELIAEGGITRLLAFYKDTNTLKIGSVRSARHYFLDYVLENDAIFVHYGYSPQAKEDIDSLKINNLNGLYDSSVFYRDKSLNRAYEHTAFTTMEKIQKGIKSKGYRNTSNVQLLKYSPIKVDYSTDETLRVANKVTIKYSNYQTTSYEYDEENMVYKMFMDGKEHTDLDTKKQYTVKNIITYQVKNVSLNDSKGRQDLENIGSGEGFYISNGEAIKIKWNKKSRDEKTKYTLMNDEELVVNDGNTWIHIQPTDQTLKIE